MKFGNWYCVPDLGALDDALSPEATAAGREGATEAVFFIGIDVVAAAAGVAWRKIKSVDLLPEFPILFGIPDRLKIALSHVPDEIGLDGPLVPVEIGRVRMKQPHARANLPVPADERAALPDEPARFDLGPDGVSHQGQIVVPPEKAEDGIFCQIVDVEPRQADLGFSRHGGERFQG